MQDITETVPLSSDCIINITIQEKNAPEVITDISSDSLEKKDINENPVVISISPTKSKRKKSLKKELIVEPTPVIHEPFSQNQILSLIPLNPNSNEQIPLLSSEFFIQAKELLAKLGIAEDSLHFDKNQIKIFNEVLSRSISGKFVHFILSTSPLKTLLLVPFVSKRDIGLPLMPINMANEVTTQGRTIPLYREVFKINQLKGRADGFLSQLYKCIPEGREVLIVMDAGFGDDWFEAIESKDWYWLVRARSGKYKY